MTNTTQIFIFRAQLAIEKGTFVHHFFNMGEAVRFVEGQSTAFGAEIRMNSIDLSTPDSVVRYMNRSEQARYNGKTSWTEGVLVALWVEGERVESNE